MSPITKFILFFAGALSLAACNSTGTAPTDDTHRSGKAELWLEESYKPLFETSIYTFHGLYPNASVKPVYKTENDILRGLFEKKVKTICITRDLTDKEKAELKKAHIEVRSTVIAHDAVALIIHPDNPDSTISVDGLKRILTGKDATWKSSGKPINVVFDNANSANFNYLHKLTDDAPLPKNVYAVKSNEQVIEHVKQNPSSIGIIGVNWISDHDDKTVLDFLKGIRVMGVSETEGSEAFQPYQAYIYTKEYPLTRDVWFINYASRSGLHSGFVNFMEQEKGQLIVHKSALVPATAPVRMIQMTEE